MEEYVFHLKSSIGENIANNIFKDNSKEKEDLIINIDHYLNLKIEDKKALNVDKVVDNISAMREKLKEKSKLITPVKNN